MSKGHVEMRCSSSHPIALLRENRLYLTLASKMIHQLSLGVLGLHAILDGHWSRTYLDHFVGLGVMSLLGQTQEHVSGGLGHWLILGLFMVQL